MPVVTQGYTRLRKHQFGRQADIDTPVAAVRAYPFSGVPQPNPNWTDAEGDFGSLVDVVAPYLGVPDLSASLSLPMVNYNDLAMLLCAFFGGAVTPTGAGTAKTWAHTPDAEDPAGFDPFTYQFGDDVASDWYQFRAGIIQQLTISGPVGLGALTGSTTWRFGDLASTGSTDFPVTGTVPTPDLKVDRNPVPVFLKDMGLWIDSAAGDIGTTQILNALHNFELTLSQEIDEKRYANAAQSFGVQAYGHGPISGALKLRFAKTADTVGTGSESDAWLSETAVDRFARLKFTSKVVAETGTPDVPYSWQLDMPLRYRTRDEENEGGNSVVALTGKFFLEPASFAGYLKSVLVNTLATV